MKKEKFSSYDSAGRKVLSVGYQVIASNWGRRNTLQGYCFPSPKFVLETVIGNHKIS